MCLLSSLWQHTCDYSSGSKSFDALFFPSMEQLLCSLPMQHLLVHALCPSSLVPFSHTETTCIRIVAPCILTLQNESHIISSFDEAHSMARTKTESDAGQVPKSMEYFEYAARRASASAMNGWDMWSSEMVVCGGASVNVYEFWRPNNVCACERRKRAMTSSFGKGGVARPRSRSRVLCTSSRKLWTAQF